MSYSVIVNELKALGTDTSKSAVERAVNHKPPYDDPAYDEIYEANGNPPPIHPESRAPP